MTTIYILFAQTIATKVNMVWDTTRFYLNLFELLFISAHIRCKLVNINQNYHVQIESIIKTKNKTLHRELRNFRFPILDFE